MLSNFNIAGLSNEELEFLIGERCAAFGTVKRIAICDSFPIVNYKLAFIAMGTPAELEMVIKKVGATSIGDAAVIRLDVRPAAPRSKAADITALGVAAVACCAALFALYMTAEQRRADVAFVQVFSKLELGQSRKEVEGIAVAYSLAIDAHSTAPTRGAFTGSCCNALVTSTRYDLVADFGADDRLLKARLLKLRSTAGAGNACALLFEIPSRADTAYPDACPADARKP